MRTPITYYGGKQQLTDRIIPMIPPHRMYVEPFFGGGAVFFAKPPSYLEVINDKNDRLMTFYRQVTENFEALQQKIAHSLHSESDYRRAKEIYNQRGEYAECSGLEMAWAVWIITNGSFSGSMHGGWKWCNGTAGSHTGRFMEGKRNEFTEALYSRLKQTQISCRDALDVIRQRDTPETFFYLDPPYPGCSQQHYSGYTHQDLYDLLVVLQNIQGKFILSNYWCQTLRYFVATNRWVVETIDMPLEVANLSSPRRKTEVLVANSRKEKGLFDNLTE